MMDEASNFNIGEACDKTTYIIIARMGFCYKVANFVSKVLKLNYEIYIRGYAATCL